MRYYGFAIPDKMHYRLKKTAERQGKACLEVIKQVLNDYLDENEEERDKKSRKKELRK